MDILTNYKIIKELGHGMVGTVYLIGKNNTNNKDNNKLMYALKIEHVERKDTKPNPKSLVWREINFYTNFGNKYPGQFVQMLEYDFIDDCVHKQTYSFDLKLFCLSAQKKFKRLASSKYCVRKVFELVDGVLEKIISKLTTQQIYSMIVQITYSIQLLHSNGYTHGDLHSGNIGWVKVQPNNKIKLSNYNVNTFGYQFKLIDFGLVLHNDLFKTKQEKISFESNMQSELTSLLNSFVDTKLYDIVNDLKIPFDFDLYYSQFKKSEYFVQIKNFTPDKQIQMFLFDIMYPDLYQKILFGSVYTKTIPRKLYLPIQDILMFVKLYQIPSRLIEYFYKKI